MKHDASKGVESEPSDTIGGNGGPTDVNGMTARMGWYRGIAV